MSLAPNTRLGRYEIRQLLGAGGMGEVYLAQDMELRRPVALKFLKAEVAVDEKRMQRFVQEARSASALNHPNILTVYEIGQANGANFFATEFVDGRTLRALLASRKMKLIEVLDVAIQIASALVAAHAAGIVHRDIKPENVMIRRDGYVKVLDFGLAKLTDGGTSQVDMEAATRALVNTDPGAVMGTVNYMSPEQASGREVDARTDIWSLGVVLYEMVTGRVPFEGATASHVIVAILEKEPLPLGAYVDGLPEALEWIVTEALTKEREERTQTARELLKRLQRLKQRVDADAEIERSVAPERLSNASGASGSAAGGSSAAGLAASGARQQSDPSALTITENTAAGTGEVAARATNVSSAEYVAGGIKSHKKAVALVLALLVLGGLSFALYKLFGQKETKQTISLQAAKFTRLTSTGKATGAAISPDGKWLVHVIDDGGQQSLWLRQVAVAGSNTQVVPPAEVKYSGLAFSPDGNYVYYTVNEKNDLEGTLYQVPVLGGTARKLLKGIGTAITFSPDGKQIAFIHFYEDKDRLMIANADGTGARQLALRQGSEYFYSGFFSSISWSPDGKTIISPVGNDPENYMSVAAVSVASGEIKFFTQRKWNLVKQVVWLADGRSVLVTAREGPSSPFKIWQVSYPSGEAQSITNDLNSYLAISLTADGNSLATVQTERVANIWVMPANDSSRAAQITQGTNFADSLSWTPDAKLVYSSNAGGSLDLYSIDSHGGEPKQLTANAGSNSQSAVSPDGRYIVFTSDRAGVPQIWRIDMDGSNPKRLTDRNGFHAHVSPDSRWVAFESSANQTTLWKVGIDGGQAVQLTDKESVGATFSPDGKQIACYYYSQEGASTQYKLAIISFEGGQPIKTFALPNVPSYLTNLRWATDGRAIMYIVTSGGVSNLLSQPFDGGTPKQLTNFTSERIFWFDISRDGKQLALSRGTVTSDIVLISDFKQ